MKKYYRKHKWSMMGLGIAEILMATVSILLTYVIQIISEFAASGSGGKRMVHTIMLVVLFLNITV